MKPTAQSLVMQVLSASNPGAVPVRALVAIADLFEIKGSTLRVTLARLLSRDLVARDERGQYRLAEGGRAVQIQVAEWTEIDHRLLEWKGRWIGAHTAGLTRTDRKRLRRRERALGFLGLREFAPGLWLRPDNWADGVAGIRRRLFELGLEEETPVYVLEQLDEAGDARARSLWDMRERRAEYEATAQQIRIAIDRVDSLPLQDAMTQTFLLGGQALRLLAFDPLLPSEISSDVELRQLAAAMRDYDLLGRPIWAKFIEANGAPRSESRAQDGLLTQGEA